MNRYLERATELKDEIIQNRRHIHQHAETGMDLPETVAFVMEKLRSYGYDPKPLGGGVTCTVGKPGGKVILLRADMDALPQNEVSGVDFACTSGKACHSCGHDSHTAMMLAAAKMLKEHEADLKGTVKFMFQPGEELILGAKTMLEAGILENPKPDAALAIHIQFGAARYTDAVTGEEIPRHPGFMLYVNGCATQSADEFHITVKGKTAHGSMPEKGVSAISAACNMVVALQQMISMEVACKDSAILTVCQINGGSAPNIICDEVKFTGTLRAFDNSLQNSLRERFENICRGVAQTFNAGLEINYRMSVPAVFNDRAFSQEMIGYAAEICPETRAILSAPGSEDFSWITANVKQGMLMNLCVGSDYEGYKYNGHDPHATIDEDSLRYGAASLAYCAEEWLAKHAAD